MSAPFHTCRYIYQTQPCLACLEERRQQLRERELGDLAASFFAAELAAGHLDKDGASGFSADSLSLLGRAIEYGRDRERARAQADAAGGAADAAARRFDVIDLA